MPSVCAPSSPAELDNRMVLMLCSSVHSIGSQMHNGRADLLFPTTHRNRWWQSSFMDGARWPPGSRHRPTRHERQFGFIIIRVRPSARLVLIDGGFKSGSLLKATFQVC